MKNSRLAMFLPAALLALAAIPAAAQQPAPAATSAQSATPSYKIGYVNTDRVMKDSRLSQNAVKVLEAEFAKRDKEIADGPPRDVERRRAALMDDMNMKREDALRQIVEKANGVIRRIAEAEKFDLVFFEAAYVHPRVDLTDKVTKALDAGR
jgi:outer membrane protein